MDTEHVILRKAEAFFSGDIEEFHQHCHLCLGLIRPGFPGI